MNISISAVTHWDVIRFENWTVWIRCVLLLYDHYILYTQCALDYIAKGDKQNTSIADRDLCGLYRYFVFTACMMYSAGGRKSSYTLFGGGGASLVIENSNETDFSIAYNETNANLADCLVNGSFLLRLLLLSFPPSFIYLLLRHLLRNGKSTKS